MRKIVVSIFPRLDTAGINWIQPARDRRWYRWFRTKWVYEQEKKKEKNSLWKHVFLWIGNGQSNAVTARTAGTRV